MKLALLSGAALLAAATSALACPDYSQTGATHEVSGEQLYAGFDLSVVAGGQNNLAECNLPGVSGVGYFITPPDFSFLLSGMAGYDLEVSVQGECDTALLVNTPSATWFFDDDSAGDLQPYLLLNAVGDGQLDAWVGTYNGEYCNATLHLETWLP